MNKKSMGLIGGQGNGMPLPSIKPMTPPGQSPSQAKPVGQPGPNVPPQQAAQWKPSVVAQLAQQPATPAPQPTNNVFTPKAAASMTIPMPKKAPVAKPSKGPKKPKLDTPQDIAKELSKTSALTPPGFADPHLLGTALGTGIGALAGGLSSKKHRVRNALIGAGLGAGTGYLGGGAYKAIAGDPREDYITSLSKEYRKTRNNNNSTYSASLRNVMDVDHSDADQLNGAYDNLQHLSRRFQDTQKQLDKDWDRNYMKANHQSIDPGVLQAGAGVAGLGGAAGLAYAATHDSDEKKKKEAEELGKAAALMATGDKRPDDWNKLLARQTHENGGIMSSGPDAWKSLDHVMREPTKMMLRPNFDSGWQAK